ncbi:Uncharacterised protein [Cedecea neteri]|uniref:Uncharacterized protein n=1 Tax=Cedecea neteri TaxID=158822 RepID=A0A2X2STQ1_9ENTR|nr:Uncharacterised protein [Cedecea neteri]
MLNSLLTACIVLNSPKCMPLSVLPQTVDNAGCRLFVIICWNKRLLKIHNRVLLLLVLLLAAALMLLPIINNAPNRLVSGEPLGITQLPGTLHYWLAIPFLMLAGLTLVPEERSLNW